MTSNELNDDSSKLPRVQNHTCSRNREPTWVRAFIQLQAIPVTLLYKDFNIETYALLDSGSDNTQITQNIADALRISVPKDIQLPLASLHGEHTVTTADVMIGIGSLHSSKPVTNLPVYATSIEQFQMPIVPAEMLNRLCRDHDHLAEINFPQIRDNKIGILIGADAFLATVPRHFTTGKPGTPYGVNTLLGWTLTGPVPQEYFQPNHKGSSNHNITLFNHLKRGSDDPDENLLHLFWTFEGVNFSQGSTKGHNEEDQKAIKTLAETTHHNGERYEIGLPWRENVMLPNNYFMARVQWHALQKRLERDNQLKQRYMTTIFDDMDKGYIAAVTNQDAKNIWYLPHHPVINKQKPDKIRRVTNAASKYKGVSLNDALLTGPDLLCNLHGLLLRFRQYKVAVTADIEAMFMQVGIREEDQDALRFLWSDNNQERTSKYQRLIFGATCSPACAIFVLQKCAHDNRQQHPKIFDSITKQFLMDDFIQTFSTEEEAANTATELKHVLKTGDSTSPSFSAITLLCWKRFQRKTELEFQSYKGYLVKHGTLNPINFFLRNPN